MRPLVEQPVALAIGAHPGYAERLCAGTLALLRERGWRIALASITAGDCTSDTLDAQAAASLRCEEARRCAALLEADHDCVGVADFAVAYGDEVCRRATSLIRQVRPAVVLTHGPEAGTPDCEETSQIVRQACLAAPVRRYATPRSGRTHPQDRADDPPRTEATDGSEPTGRIPHLYYLDPPGLVDAVGHPTEPSLIIDITGTIDTKGKMLAQFDGDVWGRSGQAGITAGLDEVFAWAKQRGEQIGIRYGEGFRQHVGPGYPRDDLLKQVLGTLACSINHNSR